MTKTTDKALIENFLMLNRSNFSVDRLDNGYSRVSLSIPKGDFNPEIARFLYDHGKDIFKGIKGANYSDVKETIDRQIIVSDVKKGARYLISNTASVIHSAIVEKNSKFNNVFNIDPNSKEKRHSFSVKMQAKAASGFDI